MFVTTHPLKMCELMKEDLGLWLHIVNVILPTWYHVQLFFLFVQANVLPTGRAK